MPLIKTGNKKTIHNPNSTSTLCECICSYCPELCWKRDGNIKEAKSCGCMQRELRRKSRTVHGMSNTRLFKTWTAMKQRCNDLNLDAYKHYGGRGIKVCDEWLDFVTFAEWAFTHGYEDNLTIDRTDNDGDYCADNCTWMTKAENTKKGHTERSN